MYVMRFRAAHLACFMLLLSFLGAADAQALARGRSLGTAHSISVLLQAGLAAMPSRTASRSAAAGMQPALPGSPLAHTQPAWTLQPPVAQSIQQHAVSGSGL